MVFLLLIHIVQLSTLLFAAPEAQVFYGPHQEKGKEVGVIEVRRLDGVLVNRVKTSYPPFLVQATPTGHFFVSLTKRASKNYRGPKHVPTPLLQEVDKNGKVIWEYKNNFMHHDFEIIGDNKFALLVWEEMSPTLEKQVKGGRVKSGWDGKMWSDSIVEIDRAGKIIWKWSASERLDPQKYPLKKHYFRDEWTHANSIRFIKKDPINGEEAYLVSFRVLDKVMFISRKTKAVIWESPDDMLSAQHDATLTPENNILIFDNDLTGWNSRILEIDPKTKKIQWQYKGGESLAEQLQFYTSIMGGVQKLDNGNYLITHSLAGRLVEISRAKKRVASFESPFESDANRFWPRHPIFRVRRYPLSYFK